MINETNPWDPKPARNPKKGEGSNPEVRTDDSNPKVCAIVVREVSAELMPVPAPANKMEIASTSTILNLTPEAETSERINLFSLAEQLHETTQKNISLLEDSLLVVYKSMQKNAPLSFTSEANQNSTIGGFAGYLDIAFQMHETKLGVTAIPRHHSVSLFEIIMGEEIVHKDKPWRLPFLKKEEAPQKSYHHSITINSSFLEGRKAVKKNEVITFDSCAEFVQYIRNHFPESEPYKSIFHHILELPLHMGDYFARVNNFLRL